MFLPHLVQQTFTLPTIDGPNDRLVVVNVSSLSEGPRLLPLHSRRRHREAGWRLWALGQTVAI
jgi:hypothetical protein